MSATVPTPEEYRQQRAEKEAAIKQGEDAARREWIDQAFDALKTVAQTRVIFHSGHVWEQLEKNGVLDGTHDGRAMAAVMMRGKREGICTPTDQYRQAKFGKRHLTSVRMWASQTWPG